MCVCHPTRGNGTPDRGGAYDSNGLVSELQLFYGVLGVTALIYVHFVCDVVGHLADHLGISCFTIPYPKRKSVIAAVAAAKKAD